MSTGWTLRRRPGRPAPSPGFPTGAHCEKWQGHRPLTLWQGHFLLVRHHPRADVRRGLGGSLILSLAETGDRQPTFGAPLLSGSIGRRPQFTEKGSLCPRL